MGASVDIRCHGGEWPAAPERCLFMLFLSMFDPSKDGILSGPVCLPTTLGGRERWESDKCSYSGSTGSDPAALGGIL